MDVKNRNRAAQKNIEIDRALNTEQETGELLAAALAATLVEYRGHVQQCECIDAENTGGTGWRMVACWERLQGSV